MDGLLKQYERVFRQNWAFSWTANIIPDRFFIWFFMRDNVDASTIKKLYRIGWIIGTITKYLLICGIPLLIGCRLAIWTNGLNAQTITPNYQPEEINWFIVIPMLTMEFAFIAVGFVAGKLYEDKYNAI